MSSTLAHVGDRAQNGPETASELLAELMDGFPNEHVTVGEFLRRLDGRAYGLLLMLAALPMCIPTPPGISTFFAIIMFVPAVQMMVGRRGAWLPKRICGMRFSREAMRKTLSAALPVLRRIERLARPRWTPIVGPTVLPIWGVVTLVMAIILVLPIPFGNFPVGVAMTVLALALLQKDGVAAILSGVLAAATLAWIYLLADKLVPAMLRQLAALSNTVAGWLP